ncbi:MAG: glycine cleavage system protein GcvH [Kiritimatiellae bacterium]|jgi:glycine cleavage system H protein|nr:glycine cleavage system protein GcvH [Kiritimatiellia bacterium]
MAVTPSDRKYTKTHEWTQVEGDLLKTGITDFAQHQLSDITYVELPAANRHISAGEEMAVVESIKAAADVYMPVAGTIVEVNENLADKPDAINADPYGEGWLVKIKPDDPQDAEKLLAASEYEKQLTE